MIKGVAGAADVVLPASRGSWEADATIGDFLQAGWPDEPWNEADGGGYEGDVDFVVYQGAEQDTETMTVWTPEPGTLALLGLGGLAALIRRRRA